MGSDCTIGSIAETRGSEGQFGAHHEPGVSGKIVARNEYFASAGRPMQTSLRDCLAGAGYVVLSMMRS
jgi:hypothetical protein